MTAATLLATLKDDAWDDQARWALEVVRRSVASLKHLEQREWATLCRSLCMLHTTAPKDQWARPALVQIANMMSIGTAGDTTQLSAEMLKAVAVALAKADVLTQEGARVLVLSVGSRCTKDELSGLCWALWQADAPRELTRLLSVTPQQVIASLSHYDLARVVWAYEQTPRVKDWLWLEELISVKTIGQLRARPALLLSVAARGTLPEDVTERLWEDAPRFCGPAIHRLGARELTTVIWAAATARAEGILPVVADRAAALCGTCPDAFANAEQLSAVVWGLSELRCTDQNVFRGLVEVARRHSVFGRRPDRAAAGEAGVTATLRFLEVLCDVPAVQRELRDIACAIAEPFAEDLRECGDLQLCAHAVVVYAKLGLPAAPIFSVTSSLCVVKGSENDAVDDLSPACAACVLWAYTAAQVPLSPAMSTALLRKAASVELCPYHQLGADGAAVCIWAAGETAGAHANFQISDLAARVVDNPSSLTPSAALYALQALPPSSDRHNVCTAIGEALERGRPRLADCSPSIVAQLAATFALANQARPQLFAAFRERLCQKSTRMKLDVGELVGSLWAFATQGISLPQHVVALYVSQALLLFRRHAGRQLHHNYGSDMALLMWSVATLATPGAVVKRLLQQAGGMAVRLGLVHHMTLLDLSSVLWSFTKVMSPGRPNDQGTSPLQSCTTTRAVFSEVCKAATARPDIWRKRNTTHVCTLLWCYAVAADQPRGYSQREVPEEQAAGIPLLQGVAGWCTQSAATDSSVPEWVNGLSARDAATVLWAFDTLLPSETKPADAIGTMATDPSWLSRWEADDVANLAWCLAATGHADSEAVDAMATYFAKPSVIATASPQGLTCIIAACAEQREGPSALEVAVLQRITGAADPPEFTPQQAGSVLRGLRVLAWADHSGAGAAKRLDEIVRIVAESEVHAAAEAASGQSSTLHEVGGVEVQRAAEPGKNSGIPPTALVPYPLRTVPIDMSAHQQPRIWPFTFTADMVRKRVRRPIVVTA